jgi:hypothetical protein
MRQKVKENAMIMLPDDTRSLLVVLFGTNTQNRFKASGAAMMRVD